MSTERTMSRTSSALKTATSTLTYAVPHLAGAIDILAVLQPDGTIRSSPFYVRFGKYSSLRSQNDQCVRIKVNDTELSFFMTLGRTGEAYFVDETEEDLSGDEGVEEAVLQGMILNPAGYSDDDETSSIAEPSSGPTGPPGALPPLPPSSSRGAALGAENLSTNARRKDVKRCASEPALRQLGLRGLSSSDKNPSASGNHSEATSPPGLPAGVMAAQAQHGSEDLEVMAGERETAAGAVPAMVLRSDEKNTSNEGEALAVAKDAAERTRDNAIQGSGGGGGRVFEAAADAVAAAPEQNEDPRANEGSLERPVLRLAEGQGAQQDGVGEPGVGLQPLTPAPQLPPPQTSSSALTQTFTTLPRTEKEHNPSLEQSEPSASSQLAPPVDGTAAQEPCAVPLQNEEESTASNKRKEEIEETGQQSPGKDLLLPAVPSLAEEDIECIATEAAASRTHALPAPVLAPGHTTTTGVDSAALSAALADVVANNENVNKAEKRRFLHQSAGPQLDLSLCWHLLHPDLTPEELLSVFEEHKIDEIAFLDAPPEELFSNSKLACRLGTQVMAFSDAQRLIIAALCFGSDTAATLHGENFSKITAYSLPPAPSSPEDSSSSGSTSPAISSPGSASPPLPDGATPRSSSWREWLTFSWRSSTGGSPRGPGSITNGGLDGGASASASASANASSGEKGGGGTLGVPPRSTSAASMSDGGVPPDQEAALLAAAAQGQASHVEIAEIRGIRKSESGKRRRVVLRKRGFVPSTEHLKELADALRMGQNKVEFVFGKTTLHAFIYFVRWDHRMIISDIDGTITKSDLLGHLGHILGYDWTHSGVTGLFAAAAANGYGLLFLSSRSIAQASITRDYLHSLEQDGAYMPQGPVIISPDGLFPSLYREVVLRRPQEFKIRCLEDIKSLFPSNFHPFVAAFGNRDTDEISYLSVGVPASRIFIINPKGELRRASSAVVASSLRSLPAMGALVDFLFPALPTKRRYQSPRVPPGKERKESSPEGKENGLEEGDHGENHSSNGEGNDLDKAGEKTVCDWQAELEDGGNGALEDTATRDEYYDYNFWRVQPSYVIDDDEELFEDALCGVDSAEGGIISTAAEGDGGSTSATVDDGLECTAAADVDLNEGSRSREGEDASEVRKLGMDCGVEQGKEIRSGSPAARVAE